ncbi:MAG: hypothetical protein ACRD1G_08350, partial [Acidimicrobiales bacterium]
LTTEARGVEVVVCGLFLIFLCLVEEWLEEQAASVAARPRAARARSVRRMGPIIARDGRRWRPAPYHDSRGDEILR